MPWGFLACWHRWRAAQLRRLARRFLALSERSHGLHERLMLASHRALIESLSCGSEAENQ
jgi:hypothetical protein